MTRKAAWIEGMRLRTLPVSMAGVVAAVALVVSSGLPAAWGWGAVCFVFALLAQIASNFANEYFDWRDGIDTAAGRRGPERGVTNGVIAPRAMLAAALVTLGAACCLGLTTVMRGGWVMLPCGALIALGALAYSAGPWPLSRHCLGEAAVVVFYGLAPVVLTVYLLTLTIPLRAWVLGLAVGLWGAMVILINNYRDIDADRAAGKHTVATAIGPAGSALLYCAFGQFAGLAMWLSTGAAFTPAAMLSVIPMMLGFYVGAILVRGGLNGRQCTRLLALTSVSMFLTLTIQLIIYLL
ncbi:MAG: 1,4-dihydroxy-2-naphthoate octaprenyltransferase [Muribaculaceae bacterium]|nr:1,4-dihydroxy-2-naphthoate octaprenyltransferase [Muribaculaceae bacterium]